MAALLEPSRHLLVDSESHELLMVGGTPTCLAQMRESSHPTTPSTPLFPACPWTATPLQTVADALETLSPALTAQSQDFVAFENPHLFAPTGAATDVNATLVISRLRDAATEGKHRNVPIEILALKGFPNPILFIWRGLPTPPCSSMELHTFLRDGRHAVVRILPQRGTMIVVGCGR